MNKALRVFLAVFMVYRLASLISSEEGPFSIFDRLRAKLGGYDYGPDGRPDTNLGRGIICPLCVGVYVAGGVTLLLSFPNRAGDLVLTWLGISGAQVFLENLTSDETIKGAIEDVADSLEDQ